jgi:F-type H+-transporting ATPase subunit b
MSILATFWLLATEERGFGLNLNIFETNLINLSILLTLLVYFGRNLLGKIMSERRAAIESAIQDAERRQKEAKAALAEQQKNLAEAQSTALKIKSDATVSAKAASEEILAQAVKDVQRMRDEAARDLNSQRDRVVLELRQRVSSAAVAKVEAQLRTGVNDGQQQALIGKSIALLGG